MEVKKFELWNDVSTLEKSVIDGNICNLLNGTIVENIEDMEKGRVTYAFFLLGRDRNI
ncbi:hypothetical protein AGMMS50276_27500 [Synergistales bacterium]|nr:hypothetical protein AGMMS50276_27500 [Synergistales bacterium]